MSDEGTIQRRNTLHWWPLEVDYVNGPEGKLTITNLETKHAVDLPATLDVMYGLKHAATELFDIVKESE